MKKSSVAETDCPIAKALTVVGDLWCMMIVREALGGTTRFNDFAKRLEVAKNVLADRLKRLVRDGILESVPASDGTSYNEYALTKMGRDLWVVLLALRQWSDRWVPGAAECGEVVIDRENGEPVGELELHAKDGRRLTLRDLALVSPQQQRKSA